VSLLQSRPRNESFTPHPVIYWDQRRIVKECTQIRKTLCHAGDNSEAKASIGITDPSSSQRLGVTQGTRSRRDLAVEQCMNRQRYQLKVPGCQLRDSPRVRDAFILGLPLVTPAACNSEDTKEERRSLQGCSKGAKSLVALPSGWTCSTQRMDLLYPADGPGRSIHRS